MLEFIRNGVLIMSEKLIYIADDEINICNIIKSFLEKEDFKVEIFPDGRAVIEAFQSREPDMLILDIMMPEMDGYSVCSYIRQKSGIPIIIVSAKDTEPDKIAGLTLGSDDYLTKPFSPMELIARAKSIFRRIELDKYNTYTENITYISDIALDPDNKQASIGGKLIALTGMEFSLLYYLALNRNRSISRSELLDKIWGFENEVETRATDDTVKRLRKKMANADSSLKIETVWGFGFKLLERG
jgi:two-component system, OmpR family, response regulator